MIDFRKLQAVIWDMDGVLVDSEPTHIAAWQFAFEKFRLPLDPGRLKRTFGMTNEMVVRTMVDSPLSLDAMDAILMEKNRVFQKAIAVDAVILPGVLDWLKSLKENGIRQAVASSSTPENIRIILDKLAIADYFEVVVSGKDSPSKPEPFIFLKTARLLDAHPRGCLVIEDSVAGVQAAKAAGMQCVAVTTTSPAGQLDDADIIVENLEKLKIEEIQSLF